MNTAHIIYQFTPELLLDPQLPAGLLSLSAAATIFYLLLAALLKQRSFGWRLFALAALWLVMLNPSLSFAEKRPLPDIVVLLRDDTLSNKLGPRHTQTEQAVAQLKLQLSADNSLQLHEATLSGQNRSELGALLQKLDSEISATRRAGVIIVGDGQYHDLNELPEKLGKAFGPVHLLLTGRPQETDRVLQLVQAPLYAKVGQSVSAMVRIDDVGAPSASNTVPLTIKQEGEPDQNITATIGRDTQIQIKLPHAGRSVIEVTAAARDDEMTTLNNSVSFSLSGVRDQLKVLLISGEPYAGLRAWRHLLKLDPAVNLVHFTILRAPDQPLSAPTQEMSLIPFPAEELFTTRLKDFDLVIFDRFRFTGFLPQSYYDNLASFVENGGALLDTSGALMATSLNSLLPTDIQGSTNARSFRPTIADAAQQHPIIAPLLPALRRANLGVWASAFPATAKPDSTTLLTRGQNDEPLLVIANAQKGRVAQILSDNIWFWTRGYDGGGPALELMRRLLHWLLREPELEPEQLSLKSAGDQLLMRWQSQAQASPPILKLTSPGGQSLDVPLQKAPDGSWQASATAERPGLYRLTDGTQEAMAILGEPDAPELRELVATPDKMQKLFDASGGGYLWWQQDGANLKLERVSNGSRAHGKGWFGLIKHNEFAIIGSKPAPALPALLVALLLLAALLWSWKKEGTQKI